MYRCWMLWDCFHGKGLSLERRVGSLILCLEAERVGIIVEILI